MSLNNLQRDMRWIKPVTALANATPHPFNALDVETDGIVYPQIGYMRLKPQRLNGQSAEFLSYGVKIQFPNGKSPVAFRVKGFALRQALFGYCWEDQNGNLSDPYYISSSERVDDILCIHEEGVNQHLVFFFTSRADIGSQVGDISVQNLLTKPPAFNSAVY